MASVHMNHRVENVLDALAPDDTVLLIWPETAADGDPEPTPELAILSADEGLGVNSIAFLIYGIPGTGSYSFFDMNKLPRNQQFSLIITNMATGQILSKNLWQGTQGNNPQAVDS